MSAAPKNLAESLAANFAGTCAVIEGTQTLALLVGPDGTILDVNQHLAERWGSAADDLKGTPFWRHMPPDRRTTVRSFFQQVAQERRPNRTEVDFGGRWYDCRWTPRLSPENEVVGVVMLGWDMTGYKPAVTSLRASEDPPQKVAHPVGIADGMTEQPQPAEALCDSQKRLNLFFNQSLDGFYFSQLDAPVVWNEATNKDAALEYFAIHQRITEANDAMLAQYGASRATFLGRLVSSFFHHNPEKGRRFQRRLFDEGRMHVESCERMESGKEVWIEGDYSCIYDDQRRIVGTFGTQRDITARKELEERLRQSQKMESIGRLAGGMAHEFNNILAALIMNLDLAGVSSQTEAAELLNESGRLCRRAAELVGKLLAFSRQSLMQPQPMDLGIVVAQNCKTLAPLLGERISVDLSLPEGLPLVCADAVVIEQVLMNLCLNARDAMKDGGKIEIRLGVVEFGPERVRDHEGAQPGRFVRLSVTDTGCGMDTETIKRLFEPFFTTKSVGQGTGLGLAMVEGIVQQHKGWVEVESLLGKGSTFHVYLPTATGLPAPLAPVAPVPPPQRSTGTILLVEDDAMIRNVTRKLFNRTGYTVLEAANGSEALGIWKERQEAIDLVYTDMVMPGDVSGLTLANRVRADKPGVKVIITSGYNTDVLKLLNIAEASIVYLPKPCDLKTLTAVVHECFQRK
jgi:PAS domain S-box-containing protein